MLLPRTMLLLSRFKKAQGGATAVEFAMVATPFFLLLTCVFDVSLIFFAQTTLDNGILAAARQIRTGAVQSNHITQQQFRQMVCNDISALLGCDSRLAIDVRNFTDFGHVTTPAVLDANGNMTGAMAFQPGAAGDVVLVRAFYTWPMLTPVSGLSFVNMAGSKRLLEASIAFRNEPF
jgi:Flp pilus assembly protein TadG